MACSAMWKALRRLHIDDLMTITMALTMIMILGMMVLKIMIMMTKTMIDKTQKQRLKNNKQKYDTHSNSSLLYCTRLRIQTSE